MISDLKYCSGNVFAYMITALKGFQRQLVEFVKDCGNGVLTVVNLMKVGAFRPLGFEL